MKVALRGFALLVVLAAACSSAETGEPGNGLATGPCGDVGGEQRFPDVVAVEASRDGAMYTFLVTVGSPYDSPARYADGWRILDPEGRVLGEHRLLHDHAGEQPFTRTQSGVEIPRGVGSVTVEARDLCFGYGGGTQTVRLP